MSPGVPPAAPDVTPGPGADPWHDSRPGSRPDVRADDRPEPLPAPPGPVAAWWRRWWGVMAVGLVLLLVVLVAVLLRPAGRGDFDPASPAPDGTRALVRVLGERGVAVEVVRSAAGVTPAPGTTVLVTQPGLVPDETLAGLGRAGRLVLLEPDAVVLDELGVPAVPAGSVGAGEADPGCRQPDAVAAGQALAGGSTYRLAGPEETARPGTLADAVLCYRDASGAGGAPRGSLVVAGPADRDVVVLGQRDLMRNSALAEAGNAALAVRLLGRHDRLQWYVPDPLELGGQDQPRPLDLLPPWVSWVAVQLLLAVLAVMLWRGRRLGAMVREPLPVVVRSAETHEGRARLYRRARARDRAAAVLRTATARRLAARLQAAEGGVPALAARVAEQTGRDPAAVRDLLTGPPPRDDAGLVDLATGLQRVEDHLRARTAGGGQDAGPGRRPAPEAPTAAPTTAPGPPPDRAPRRAPRSTPHPTGETKDGDDH